MRALGGVGLVLCTIVSCAAAASSFGAAEGLYIRLNDFETPVIITSSPAASSSVTTDFAAAKSAIEKAEKEILADPLINNDRTLLGVDVMVDNEGVILQKLTGALLQRKKFVISFGGSSVTAGHDNKFSDAYPSVMEQFLKPAMEQAGAPLTVRNHAMGGTASTPWSLCLRNHLGEDTDIAVWEFAMIDAGNGGDHLHLKEYFLRAALRLPKQPAILFVFSDFPRRSEEKNKNGQTCRHQPPNKRAGCSPNMGLSERDGKPNMDKGSYNVPGDLLKVYHDFGLHAQVLEKALWNKDHAAPYDHWSLHMEGKPYGGGEWHPAPKGHRLRGLLLAWFYLGMLKKAIAQLGDSATRQAAEKAMANFAPKPLPKPSGCFKKVCDQEPKCATSFEPRVQGDLREILSEPTGKWQIKLSPADVGPGDTLRVTLVREAERRKMGYLDKKYVLMGSTTDEWQGLALKGAKTGPVVVCEPNTGWTRPGGMGKVRDDLEFLLDGKACSPSTDRKDFGPALMKVKGAGDVPMCVVVAKTLTPGDHVLKVKVKNPKVRYVAIAQVVWW